MREDWIYHRGDIYYVDFGSRYGSEQNGKRPAIVIQNEVGNLHAPTLTVVPVTSNVKKTHQPTHFIFCHSVIKKKSMAMAEQIQTIDKQRILSYVGKLNEQQMSDLEKAVQAHLGLCVEKTSV